tara:strand:+ start:456 stop:791 length:336 start_codon:yes stop_codon:yes gene_type:complete
MITIKKMKAKAPFDDDKKTNIGLIFEMTDGSIISAFLENSLCWNVTQIVDCMGEDCLLLSQVFMIDSADISVLNTVACLIANDKLKWNNGFKSISKSTITKQWNKMERESK